MKIATSALLLVLTGGVAWMETPAALAQAPAAPKSKAVPKPAGPGAQATDRWPLRSVVFRGSKLFPAEQLMALSGLKLEALAGKEDFDMARDRLYATGCLDAVAYVFEPAGGRGIQVTFEVGDVEERGGWRIEGLKLEPKEYAARAGKTLPLFGPVIPLTEVYAKRMSELAETMLKEKGVNETVIVKFEAGLQEGVVAVLRSKTPPPNIAEVIFKGSRAVPAPEVQKAMSGVAVGTPWDELMFRTFLETTARAMYDAYGRLGAKFVAITTEPSKNGRGVAVTVNVDEGPVYKLKRLDIAGAPIREEEVNSLGGDSFKSGGTANLSEIGRGVAKVIERLKELGYLRATYHAAKQMDDEAKTVDIRIEIEPGAQYKMGRLDIDGLDIESEPVIRKMWVMKPGEPYRGGYPEMFLAQVKQRGMLDYLGSTKAETKVDYQQAVVDVRLTFKGGPQKLDSRPRDSHGELQQPQGPKAF
ncbi:MAG: POTRA domain-containing protein [Bryobacteraceae bacterium]